ncbi:unnamed protein product [Owenia fusiformis]|uniref:Uncharacterized protein n=1 Tax=Owenia fusiformis TaxID=6347 RepID=A0A8J1TFG4_OWEFU|nr:unnamed protein product [Owenia fusiformis]
MLPSKLKTTIHMRHSNADKLGLMGNCSLRLLFTLWLWTILAVQGTYGSNVNGQKVKCPRTSKSSNGICYAMVTSHCANYSTAHFACNGLRGDGIENPHLSSISNNTLDSLLIQEYNGGKRFYSFDGKLEEVRDDTVFWVARRDDNNNTGCYVIQVNTGSLIKQECSEENNFICALETRGPWMNTLYMDPTFEHEFICPGTPKSAYKLTRISTLKFHTREPILMKEPDYDGNLETENSTAFSGNLETNSTTVTSKETKEISSTEATPSIMNHNTVQNTTILTLKDNRTQNISDPKENNINKMEIIVLHPIKGIFVHNTDYHRAKRRHYEPTEAKQAAFVGFPPVCAMVIFLVVIVLLDLPKIKHDLINGSK